MRRKRLTLLTLFLMLGAAVLAACGGGNSEPAALPAESESQPESQSEADSAGAPGETGETGEAESGETGEAETESSPAGQPKFVEFYADW